MYFDITGHAEWINGVHIGITVSSEVHIYKPYDAKEVNIAHTWLFSGSSDLWRSFTVWTDSRPFSTRSGTDKNIYI